MEQRPLIDVIAPSSMPENRDWRKGIKILQSWGFKVRFNSSMLSPHLFHSNTDKKRSFFLQKAFSSKDSSIVWMLRGGYGFQKILDSYIKKSSKNFKRKLFIGYSDGTALHSYLNNKNQKTLHAPTVSELINLSQKELNLLKEILLGNIDKIMFKNLKVFNPSKKTLKARIMGGNLSLLSSSIGTSWQSSFKKGFLFLEDVNEEAYKVDRMLYHLFYSGALKSIQAILFGGFNPIRSLDFLKVLKSFSKACSIPLVFNLPCGHKRKQPLPFNTSAQLFLRGSKADLEVKTFNKK
ncbi:MAG: LD-carboxypeptidase [Bdellovibrionaceae bacterium]|nr:LD-carboxypeptidase [Pseudobdellovibrionaceae bacterium]